MRLGKQFAILLLTLAALVIPLSSCSSSQQEEGEMETSQEEGQDGEEGQLENEEGQQNQVAENAEGQQEEGFQGEQQEQFAGTEGGDSSQNDLEEIINQMNQDAGNMAEGDGFLGGEAGAEELGTGDNAGMGGEMAGQGSDMMADQSTPMENSSIVEENTATSQPVQVGNTVMTLPEPNSKMPYIVQKGDTLGSISGKIFGDKNRWREIAQLSALSNPNKLYPGDVVYYTLSAESNAFAQAYESAPMNEYKIQQGDTLATIAATVYGASSMWKTIWRQNGHVSNPDKLEVGQVIYYVDQSALTTAIDKVSQAKFATLVNTKQLAKIG